MTWQAILGNDLIALGSILIALAAIVFALRARRDAARSRHALAFFARMQFERQPASTRELARSVAEACLANEAKLAAMSREDRERAIDDWAKKLAEDSASIAD